ncbi:anti-sigma factor family protein [Amycolatopsis benzoatilytica]|uniref:anti-sigma factor family protein n=1 Tax=Amycolatopsis benzoatilytica TaxID=346045 RepID=UPI000370D48E|nr:zf-HC2 domain-containing protein [Amycolatopsis benzoatilytica]
MNTADEHVDLAGYLSGQLASGERRDIEAHLAECERCRAEAASLREVQSFLGELPPEALLEGPPVGADGVVQRTVDRIRAESHAQFDRGRMLALAAAAVVVLAALGIGVLVGRSTSGTAVAVPPSPVMSSPAPVPGSKVLTGADASGRTRLIASIVPAAGWVRVNASVSGIPAGEKCLLVVLGKKGERQVAGGWLVSEQAAKDGASLYGSAVVDPAEVSAIVIENTAGHRFVEADS